MLGSQDQDGAARKAEQAAYEENMVSAFMTRLGYGENPMTPNVGNREMRRQYAYLEDELRIFDGRLADNDVERLGNSVFLITDAFMDTRYLTFDFFYRIAQYMESALTKSGIASEVISSLGDHLIRKTQLAATKK